MMANRRNFKQRVAKYLASKVLTYDNWSDSISDGRKGDELALYGLCMLFSQHAVVHLHNDLIWSTLASSNNNYLDDLQKCNIHLCYLVRGLFMELVQHDIPLQILDDKPNVQSIVIGELSMEEESTYKVVSQTGLGVAKNAMTMKVDAEDAASTSQCNTDPSGTQLYQSCAKEASTLTQPVKILVVKMNISDPNKSYQVTQQLLQLPKSRYRPDDYLEKLAPAQHEPASVASDMHGDSDATLLYSSSHETIPYWPLGDDKLSTSLSTLDIHKKTESTTSVKNTINWKILTKCRFNIDLYGIRKYHRHYYFKCAEANSNRSFNKVRDWNMHHHIIHSTS